MVQRSVVAIVLYVLSILVSILNVLDTLWMDRDIVFSHFEMGVFSGAILIMGIVVSFVLMVIANLFMPKMKWNLYAVGSMLIPVFMLIFIEGRFA